MMIMKRMKKIILIVPLLVMSMLSYGHQGTMVRAGKAFLEQLQKRDSVLIADQLRYGFRMENVKVGTMINLPDFSHGICDSLDLVSGWSLDTLKIRKKVSELNLEGSVVLTSFDEGSYRLPDIAVQRIEPDGTVDTLVFEGLQLDVKSMPVDTASFTPHDIKGQIRYPLTLAEVLPYIIGIQLVALLVILAWALIRTRKKLAGGENVSREPPYIVALKKLDHYRGNKLWAPDKQKQFYSGITDVMREYIAARFGIGAMEMTTAEIFDGLKDKDIPAPLMEEARNLFVMSDLVKFAKMIVSDDDNIKAVPSAVRFVTSTWKTEEETDKEEGK